jgi:hypothetical protein
LEKRKDEILSKDVQVILRTGDVHFVRIHKLDMDIVESKNQFGHKMRFMVKDIEECIIDYQDAR